MRKGGILLKRGVLLRVQNFEFKWKEKVKIVKNVSYLYHCQLTDFNFLNLTHTILFIFENSFKRNFRIN